MFIFIEENLTVTVSNTITFQKWNPIWPTKPYLELRTYF